MKPQDTVIHLGDCAWRLEGMKRLLGLPGKKILVRGNHDDKSLGKYMEMGWDFACDSIVMKLGGVVILFSHKPRLGHQADINIHGHFHDLHREDFSRLYLPLSLEAMGYQPIALDTELLGTMASWVSRQRIPKLKEIYELKQNHRPLSLRDIYGQHGKERFIRKFDGTPEPDIHAILKSFARFSPLLPDFVKGEITMKKYEKGYHDAQWEMANRLYECYLNKYIFGMNWQMIEYITGLSLDDLEKLLFEYDEELTAACLAESDSLEEKIYRLHIERYSNEYIQEQLGVMEEKIRSVIEGKDGCCKYVYNTVYQKLKAKKHKNIAEYQYYRNFTIGQKTGYEEVRWEWVQRLHTAGMNEDKISEILTYPQKEVERLLMMNKEDIKGWVEDHWQDEN